MATTWCKPAGIPTLTPHADPDGDCVLARLLVAEPWRAEISWPAGFAGGIAHRLDISTSGALWVADDVEELAQMRQRFADRRLRKVYRLRAARPVPWDENTVRARLGHARGRKGRVVAERGQQTPHRGRWRDAETRFLRVGGDLFEAHMRTGVMHQIRVHGAFAGLPLLGDRRYGGGPTPATAPPGVTFFLHHLGLRDDAGWGTDEVTLPEWARHERDGPPPPG